MADATALLASNSEWFRFLAAVDAILLTFLAGAELDPQVIGTQLKEVALVEGVGFAAPFLGCVAGLFCVGLGANASWLTRIACQQYPGWSSMPLCWRLASTRPNTTEGGGLLY